MIGGLQRVKMLELVAADKTLGTVKAARLAGLTGTRSEIKALIDADEELVGELADARGRGPETIRAEIRRRAIEGVEEPVFHNGEQVAVVRKFSDRLLGLMAKALLPEYRDAEHVRLEVTGADAGPIQVEGRAVVGLADVVALARKLGVGPLDGLDAGPARGTVSPAQDVLSDPPQRERAAGALPAPRPD